MKIETPQWTPARGWNGSTRTVEEIFRTGVSDDGATTALVSCVGRELGLDQRSAEEVEAAREHFPAGTPAIGFYSNREIGPAGPAHGCDLHSPTMMLTVPWRSRVR